MMTDEEIAAGDLGDEIDLWAAGLALLGFILLTIYCMAVALAV
jgi:hypothetical protein